MLFFKSELVIYWEIMSEQDFFKHALNEALEDVENNDYGVGLGFGPVNISPSSGYFQV